MLRILVTLALLHCVVPASLLAQDDHKLSLGLGPALWFELGDGECEHDSDTVSCTSLFEGGYAGARGRVDLDLLGWLRTGGQLGFGMRLDGSESAGTSGYRETLRQWFVPMGIHAYAYLDRGRLNLWLGPELFYTLRIDRRARRESSSAPEVVARDTRSGCAAGLALGLDVRLGSHLWLGFELAEAVSFSERQQLPRRVTSHDPNSLTRLGVLLRMQL